MGLNEKPMVLVVGGSLGADKINNAMIEYIKKLSVKSNIQILFATGTRNYDAVTARMKAEGINIESNADIKVVPYIYNMDEAMTAADVVISRGGAITLTVSGHADTAVIEIADAGPGVAEGDRARIFEPFYRGERQPEHMVKGTGIGLSIVQEYIAAHGGRIALLPEGPGARFRIELPK